MGLKCGIVGLPNVGKSTLFNALSSAKAQAANFPFCTIEPNLGTITVPDERLNRLAEIAHPEKITPTSIEIVDIAGLVEGASKGEGLGNQFLSHIRETHAILHVVRCFVDDNITHVSGTVNPVRDKEIIDTELQIKDLDTIEKRILKAEKSAKSGEKDAKAELALLLRLKEHLASGRSARELEMKEDEAAITSTLHLLTGKPVLYVCNVDEGSMPGGNAYVEALREAIRAEKAGLMVICAAMEAEISELESLSDRTAFLKDMGLEEPGVNRLVKAAYGLLDLITYFTQGEPEVRAWTIPAGFNAQQSAGVIHTDFERGFIKAEVIAYNDFISLGSEQACRDAGKLRTEGKEYLVQDGDIMHFRFNV